MPKEYVHLSLLERDQITILRHDKKSMGDIAKSLGRSKSSISREIKRNSSAEYNLYMSHRAHERSELRREQASARLRLKDALIVSYVTTKLKLNWSPEIIAGTIKLEQPGLSISHEAIYQYIYHPDTENRQELIGYLARAHRKRRPKGIGRKARKTKIPNRVPIDDRPARSQSAILTQPLGCFVSKSLIDSERGGKKGDSGGTKKIGPAKGV